jgi:rfaE bifunctional protein kinase chain/domain
MRGKRMGVLGDFMLDRYLWGEATRISPESPVPVVDFAEQQECLGGAGNVAANLASLGAEVEAFGVTGAARGGEDEAGRALRRALRAAGISDRGVIADAGRLTTLKTRIIARHQQIARVDHERRSPLAAKIEDIIFRRFAESAKNLDGLVLSDYDKGVITDSLSERVMGLSHKQGIPVFVSPKKPRLFVHRGARVVVCNIFEAGRFVTHALTDEKSIDEAGRTLLATFGCGAVVITRGGEDMSVFEETTPHHLRIFATSLDPNYSNVGRRSVEREVGRQVVDRTGAGDTVLAVLSLGVVAGATTPDAATLANAAAGVVVSKIGTATVSPKELEHALQEIRV